jgi:hypothetical protein
MKKLWQGKGGRVGKGGCHIKYENSVGIIKKLRFEPKLRELNN